MPTEVLDGIFTTAFDAFGPGITREEVLAHIRPANRLYVAYGMGTVVGFATAKRDYNPQRIDFVGAAVRPCAERNGIYKQFCTSRINFTLESAMNCFTLRTQNPKILAGIERSLQELTDVGFLSGFKMRPERRTGLYGRMLTQERPLSGVARIDSIFADLDYAAGDALEFTVTLRDPQHTLRRNDNMYPCEPCLEIAREDFARCGC